MTKTVIALPLSYNRIVRKQRNRLESNQGNRSGRRSLAPPTAAPRIYSHRS